MLFGYIWEASADDESVCGQQHQRLMAAGVIAKNLYKDVEGQRRQPRPALEACLSTLRSGDTLVVWQLHRLVDGRVPLLNLLQELQRRQLGLRVLAGQGAVLSTVQTSLTVSIPIIAALVDLEAYIAREATLVGLSAAREKGQILGAKPKMTPDVLRRSMAALADTDASFTAIAEAQGITRATLYNYLNGDGSLKPAGLKLLGLKE